jgi:hypothetical protein
MVACEREHPVCDPAALRSPPLIKPDPAGAILLTRQQVLTEFARPGRLTVTRAGR